MIRIQKISQIYLFNYFPAEQKKNPKRKIAADLDDDMDVEPALKYKGKGYSLENMISGKCGTVVHHRTRCHKQYGSTTSALHTFIYVCK